MLACKDMIQRVCNACRKPEGTVPDKKQMHSFASCTSGAGRGFVAFSGSMRVPYGVLHKGCASTASALPTQLTLTEARIFVSFTLLFVLSQLVLLLIVGRYDHRTRRKQHGRTCLAPEPNSTRYMGCLSKLYCHDLPLYLDVYAHQHRVASSKELGANRAPHGMVLRQLSDARSARIECMVCHPIVPAPFWSLNSTDRVPGHSTTLRTFS